MCVGGVCVLLEFDVASLAALVCDLEDSRACVFWTWGLECSRAAAGGRRGPAAWFSPGEGGCGGFIQEGSVDFKRLNWIHFSVARPAADVFYIKLLDSPRTSHCFTFL